MIGFNPHPCTRVVLILVDGMRPDGLEQADTPAMDAIMREGTYTLNAWTTFPTVTLPCHASLFLGVPPERHGVLTNTWVPQVRPVPGLFDVLHNAGKTAATFYNWEQLRDLSTPGSLAASLMLRHPEAPGHRADWELTQAAQGWLTNNDFDFAFIYLGNTDVVGHDHGWMSEPYKAAIAEADRCIGSLMDVLSSETVTIVLADHGGHQRMHGTDLEDDMRIPILARGPGIKAGHLLGDGTSILDVAPSILYLLDVPVPRAWTGACLWEQ